MKALSPDIFASYAAVVFVPGTKILMLAPSEMVCTVHREVVLPYQPTSEESVLRVVASRCLDTIVPVRLCARGRESRVSSHLLRFYIT